MKFIAALIFFLLPFFGNTQEKNSKDSILDFSYGRQLVDSVVLDSFTFCKARFAIPRDCDKKSQVNCCSHNPYPPQTACYNGTGLFWTYFKNINIAEQNVESLLGQMIKQQKKVEAEPVMCNLMGTKTKGYRLACITRENHKWYEVITAGIVNGQPVLVELHTSKPLQNNKRLQPVFQQIISLAE